jgi:hypothetical protein
MSNLNIEVRLSVRSHGLAPLVGLVDCLLNWRLSLHTDCTMQELQVFAQEEVANGLLAGLDRIYKEAVGRGIFNGISPTPADKQWAYNTLRTIIMKVNKQRKYSMLRTHENPKSIQAHRGSLLGPCSGVLDHCIVDC